MAMHPNEIARRSRARKRGEDIPKIQPGPKKGFKQTPEHVAKRSKWGQEHHAWIGDAIQPKSGRTRALRRFKEIGPCAKCGANKSERHHINGNTADNGAENIMALCRRYHVRIHRSAHVAE